MSSCVRGPGDAGSHVGGRHAPPRRRSEAGFSYVEVLVATALIAMALVPTLQSLSVAVLGAGIHLDMTEADSHLSSRLDEVLAEPFAALDAAAVAVGSPTSPTAYSDAGGSARRRLVYLARYDGDNADGDGNRFTGGDAGLLWVSVKLEGTDRSLETLTTN
jgi:type II secretory pathway pseudopilin PulG